MDITLTPNGEELMRVVLSRHPGHSAVEIVEQALAEQLARETAEPSVQSPPHKLAARLDRWLEDFARYSAKIPALPEETFSREMIYQDHD